MEPKTNTALYRLVIDGVPQPNVGLYLPAEGGPQVGDALDQEDGGRLLVERVAPYPKGGFVLFLTTTAGN